MVMFLIISVKRTIVIGLRVKRKRLEGIYIL